MKQRELVLQGKQTLEQADVPEADADARLLWLYLSGQNSAEYLLAAQDEVKDDVCNAYRELIARRAMRIPLQRITGTQSFMGYEFEVADDVLIPRYDTEILAEQAQKKLQSMRRKREDAGMETKISVLDLCCGSGCIGLSLARLQPDLQMELADISDAAIRLTRKNADRLHVNVKVIKSDLFDKIENSYDMIVSNPPYIEEEAIGGLMPEVRMYEPKLALAGGADGLDFYRRMTEQAGRYLHEDGWLLFEIGDHQAYDVQRFLVDAGFSDVRAVRDLAGRDRVVMGRKCGRI